MLHHLGTVYVTFEGRGHKVKVHGHGTKTNTAQQLLVWPTAAE